MNRHQRRANEKRKLQLYNARDCGKCDVCCTLMEVGGIPATYEYMLAKMPDGPDKDAFIARADEAKAKGWRKEYFAVIPENVPCPHLRPEQKGCGIYEIRPKICREWACEWRGGGDLLEASERPDRCGVMLETVARSELPWTFLKAREVRAGGFEEAEAMLNRIAGKGQLVILLGKESWRLLGPQDRVEAFQALVVKQLREQKK